jgi:HK97 family phage portal protein
MAITGYPGWVDKLKNGEGVNGTIDAYSLVPMLYRSVNLRCDAISTVPYRLFRNENEVAWPWNQNLANLMKDTERSLLLTGAAYWLKLYRGRVLTGFQFLNPLSMTVRFDATKAEPGNPFAGVTFRQSIQGREYGPWTTQEIIYFREPSLTDEVGPGLAPARVALQSAQLAHYLERFTSAFFEGGAQPITVLNLPETMDEAEFKRFQGEWTMRFQGVVNAFRTAFVRSPDLKVTTITPPINTLLLPELQERAITAVSMTLGVPRTMLEASAANFATADSDRQSFWRETIIPRLSLYEQVINDQLLYALNYEMQFNPEALDVMQADEANRAGSLLQLVQAGVPLRGAMKILGYDQIEEALGPEPEPTPPTSPDATPTEPSAAVSEEVQPSQDITPDEVDEAIATKRKAEFGLLAKKLERRIKAGKSIACSFESDVITADEVKSVMDCIADGMTVDEVHEVVNAIKAIDDLTPDEKRVYNRIVGAMEKRGATWARQIVQGKDVDPSLKDVLEPVMITELQTTMSGRVDRLGTQFGIGVDPADEGVIIQDWLSDYMPSFNREIDSTTRKVLERAIATYRTTPGMTIQDLAKLIAPASGKARASSIAITETTRAASQATVEYQKYLGARGVLMERVWNTDADDLVCPICAPLNGKNEDFWITDYPLGPPAHVRCRCDTGLRVIRE